MAVRVSIRSCLQTLWSRRCCRDVLRGRSATHGYTTLQICSLQISVFQHNFQISPDLNQITADETRTQPPHNRLRLSKPKRATYLYPHYLLISIQTTQADTPHVGHDLISIWTAITQFSVLRFESVEKILQLDAVFGIVDCRVHLVHESSQLFT